MSNKLTDRRLIPHGLFHYFSAGFTRDEALANLLRSHERNSKLFPRIDYREVDFWYNSFQNGNFDFRQKLKYPDLSKLENLPVLDHIIHNVNTDDQISLRQVCRKIKSAIDTENRLYDEIQLNLCNNHILLTVFNAIDNKKTKTIYKRKDEGCEIRKEKKITESEIYFIDAALAEFKTTVVKVNTKVKNMIVKFRDSISNTVRDHFFSSIVPILSNLKRKLHVENLNVSVSNTKELDDVLGCIRIGTLEKLDVHIKNKTYKPFEINTVSNFASHSSHLCSLVVPTPDLVVNLESIANIPNVLIGLETTTAEEFLEYKDAIQNSPKFERHAFLLDGMQHLRNAMKPFATIDEEFGIDEDDSTENRDFKGFLAITGQPNHHIEFEVGFKITFAKKPIRKDI